VVAQEPVHRAAEAAHPQAAAEVALPAQAHRAQEDQVQAVQDVDKQMNG
jgi:hypothetical protein